MAVNIFNILQEIIVRKNLMRSNFVNYPKAIFTRIVSSAPYGFNHKITFNTTRQTKLSHGTGSHAPEPIKICHASYVNTNLWAIHNHCLKETHFGSSLGILLINHNRV